MSHDDPTQPAKAGLCHWEASLNTFCFPSLSVIALQYFIFIVYRVPTLILPSNSLSVSYHGIPTISNNLFQTGS